jgi:ribosomal protein L4
MLRTEGLNVYDIVKHDWLILTQDAVKAIETRLGE